MYYLVPDVFSRFQSKHAQNWFELKYLKLHINKQIFCMDS